MIKQFHLTTLAALLAAVFSSPITAGGTYSSGSGSYSYDSGGGNACISSSSFNRSLNVVGLTSDRRLVCFNEGSPGQATNIGTITGFTMPDTTLVGIDYRVQNGRLYGVGDAGGIYLINVSNATATLVNRLSVALSGTSFGVDFNPPADRLRIVSDTGQNLRHNINTGGVTAVDDALDYPPGTLNTVGPTALGIVGSAYTNNDLDATTNTTLYALDSNLDQISVQSPPNNGSLVATGKLTVDATAVVGFDTYSTVRNGVTVNVQSLASIKTTDGATNLYSMNVPTGKATSRGSFTPENQVIDIAIPLNQL